MELAKACFRPFGVGTGWYNYPQLDEYIRKRQTDLKKLKVFLTTEWGFIILFSIMLKGIIVTC